MTTKAELRADLLARRAGMSAAERSEAAEAIALHATALPLVGHARRVAIYLSMASEPGTAPLVAALAARGIEMIAPVTGPDRSLRWAVVTPDSDTAATSLGMAEPTARPLGDDALASCDVVLLPALAVDHAGRRLGRGAGYYDRAVAGLTVPLCALVFAHELLKRLPAEPHDVPVQMALTPHGLFRVPQNLLPGGPLDGLEPFDG